MLCFLPGKTKRFSQAIPAPKLMRFRPKEWCSWEECVCWRITHKNYCMSDQNYGKAKLGRAGRPIFWLSISTLTTICMVLFHVASWVDFVFSCSLGGTDSIRGHDELAGEAVLAVLSSIFRSPSCPVWQEFWQNQLTWILRGSRWRQPIRSLVVLLCCACCSAFIFCFMHHRVMFLFLAFGQVLSMTCPSLREVKTDLTICATVDGKSGGALVL